MEATRTTDDSSIHQVLIVDDEPDILTALGYVIRSPSIKLLKANSGAEALAIVKATSVDVIISDMLMPEMTGAQLLEEVFKASPDTYRIILTGHADLSSTLQAINQAQVQRVLLKPWDNSELMDIITQGIAQSQLRKDNERLKQLLVRQNKQLKTDNADLESVVAKRTKQLRGLLAKIERRNQALEKVLYNVISINPNVDGKFALDVSDLVERLCRTMGIKQEHKRIYQYAALICEIGLLGSEPENFSLAYQQMTFAQQDAYINQGKQAALILAPSEHLNTVSDIIQHQFEHINGSGPLGKTTEDIPVGSRIIAVARDYWRYISGRITGQRMTPEEAKREMKKYRETYYDGVILDILLRDEEIGLPTHLDDTLAVDLLEPGMVLANNIYNDNHILLLPQGHVFTDETINKLKIYESKFDLTLTIAVEHAKEEDEKP